MNGKEFELALARIEEKFGKDFLAGFLMGMGKKDKQLTKKERDIVAGIRAAAMHNQVLAAMLAEAKSKQTAAGLKEGGKARYKRWAQGDVVSVEIVKIHDTGRVTVSLNGNNFAVEARNLFL